MRNVEIRVYPIAKSTINDVVVKEWLNSVGAVSYQWPQPDQQITSAEAVIGLAAKRCYMSFTTEDGLNPNVTKVRKEWSEYFENILKSGHGSVLEHATYTFAIEGVSRVLTGELNRHRAGVAISEGSMRYIRFTDIPWWMPTSIRLSDEEKALLSGAPFGTALSIPYGDFTDDQLMKFKIAKNKWQTQKIFNEVFSFVEKKYVELVDLWELDTDKSLSFHFKKQLTSCLRRIIPLGVSTGALYTMNLRAIRHVLELRTSAAAEEEIAHVFGQIGKYIIQSEPRLFGDFEQTPEGYYVPKYHKV